MDLRTWKNGYIDRTIGLKLHFNNGSVNISGTDETWFLGKCVQLDGFFKRKRPWYGILNWILPGLLGAMMVISVLALAIGIEAKSGLGVVSSSILIVANPFLLWLGLKQKIFPFIRVILSDPHRRLVNYDFWVFIVAVLTLLVAIFSVVAPLVKHPNQSLQPTSPRDVR